MTRPGGSEVLEVVDADDETVAGQGQHAATGVDSLTPEYDFEPSADEVLDAILDELSASGVRRMPDVALVTDGRMSGASGKVPAAIHVSPEALAGGPLAHVRDGDVIEFDIPNRRVDLLVDDEELVRRRAEQDAKGWAPAAPRERHVSPALKIFAKFAQSADKGAARKVD